MKKETICSVYFLSLLRFWFGIGNYFAFSLFFILVTGFIFPAKGDIQVPSKSVPLSERGKFELSAWADLPVCRDGRLMPLDAFARTHVRLICGRENPRILFENGAKRKFQASEILFSWLTEPELWTEVPFLPLEDATVRELMGLPVFDEAGNRLAKVSPGKFSEVFNSVSFNEKYSRKLQTLSEAEAVLATLKEKNITSGRDFDRETQIVREIRALKSRLETVENRYVTWLRLISNPTRNLEPEKDSVLRDSAHLNYMGQTVSLSYVEQNLIFTFCDSYEPRISLRGASIDKIPAEDLAQIREKLHIPDLPSKKFTPAELYLSMLEYPKLWKYVPFLYLEDVELRKMFGFATAPEGEMPYLYVAPMDLVNAMQTKSEEFRKAFPELSPEKRELLGRLEMGLQLYCFWLDGQFLDKVPLGQEFWANYEKLRNCWHGLAHGGMAQAQPLDVQLLTVVLQRSPALFQKMASGWRTVSPGMNFNEALGNGQLSESQWNYLFSCMGDNSPELEFFKAMRSVTKAFRNVDLALSAPRPGNVGDDAPITGEKRLALISRNLAELRKAAAGVLPPFEEYCRSARKKMSENPSEQDEEWYSWLVVSRLSFRNFMECAAALQYLLFDEDLSLCVLPTLESGPLNRNRTEKVQIFAQDFSLHSPPWLSLNALRFGDFEHGFSAAWPDAAKREMAAVRESFQKMALAWKMNEPEHFRTASLRFAEQMRAAAVSLDETRSKVLSADELDEDALASTRYPKTDFLMRLETFYSRLRPFVWAWILPFAAMLILGASMMFETLAQKAAREETMTVRTSSTGNTDSMKNVSGIPQSARLIFERFGIRTFWLGFSLLAAGVLASTAGLALRSWIMNRAPVTNMFETIVFVAWSAGVFGMFLTFRMTFARIITLGWAVVQFSRYSRDNALEKNAGDTIHAEKEQITSETQWKPERPEVSISFRASFWILRGLLALGIFFVLGFYGLGSGAGYTAVRLTPALAVGASMPSLSAWVEWFSGILMLAAFLWWMPLFILAPLAGSILYVTKNRWTDEEKKKLERQRFLRPFFAGAAALVVFVISYVSISFPDIFKPDLRNLAPILRDNYWLAVHVVTIVASYGAGMLAWGLADGALCCYLFGKYRDVDGKRRPPEICSTLSELLYRCMQAAVLLLVVGTILGGLWADVSWGKFWSWDRKEVWALISLFVYLLILHGRYVRLLGEFTLAVGAVLGAFAIIMAWYGVNYVMGSALHGYGAGAGSLFYGLMIMGVNMLLITGAVVRYYWEKSRKS